MYLLRIQNVSNEKANWLHKNGLQFINNLIVKYVESIG